ncbi:hypothetical protein F5B18DRAFT_631719 [Nemania serpens]|nr:hypothetical protein F5B18DRAFT_631719 [Nemania serpens]
MDPKRLAFLVHAVVETAAGLSFIIHPEGQLPACTSAGKLILRQYGGLLLASSMVCVVTIADPDISVTTTRLMAVALGSYHVWPCHRALFRMRTEAPSTAKDRSVLGGPLLHFMVHAICLGLFLSAAIAEM